MNNHPVSDSLVSRRAFVSRLALAGAALPLAGAVAHAQTEKKKEKAAPAAAKPTSGTGKLGTLHVFAKPLQVFSYEETAKLIAEAGYGGIDYAVRKGGHVLPEKAAEDLPRAIEAASKAGLKVEMITTDVVNAADANSVAMLRVAAKHGVKVYRFGNFSYDPKLSVMESLAKTRATIKELAALNQSLGIHGAIQNHSGTRVGSAIWDLYEVLRESDPRWVGVQYDIRHAVVEGGQSWPNPLRLVAPWVKCVDLKDFKWEQSPGKALIENTPIGEGIVPFDAYFKMVREQGIQGPVSVHLEYPPFERAKIDESQRRSLFLAAMKKDLAALKPHLTKHQLS